MPPSISEEQAWGGCNTEQPKTYCFEQDPGITARAVIAHELLISAHQKQAERFDGG